MMNQYLVMLTQRQHKMVTVEAINQQQAIMLAIQNQGEIVHTPPKHIEKASAKLIGNADGPQ